jgi:putative ABC transport system permease protein
MLANYFKIAWRTILRHKGYSSINLLGLAMGMTCCLFILLWVRDEKSVDNFHSGGKDLYSIYQTYTANGAIAGDYNSPLKFIGNTIQFPLDDVQKAIPEIKGYSYYATGYELPWGHAETIQYGDKTVKLNGSRASEDFFRLFSYPVIQGSADYALKEVNDIAISRKMANIFFGSPAEAIGKTLRHENSRNLVVTAVFEDLPAQSSLQFDFLLTWAVQRSGQLPWSSNNFQTFLRLAPGTDPKLVASKLNRFTLNRINDPSVKLQLGLQPYGERYLHSTFVNGKPVTGRIEYVRIFSGVAIFILLIACINFMNLATARSVRRAKEVGLRKVVGSTRTRLISQFFGESLLFSLMAMFLSTLLLLIFLPAFNHFTDKHILFPYADVSFWAGMVTILLLTGIVAGSYPALYLSSLKPVAVLKGIFRFTSSAIWLRKGLTVFQFSLSILLLIATIVIVRQTEYVQNSNLGYNRENLVYIQVEGELSKMDKYELFKQQALASPGIAMVDRSSEAPHAMNFVAAFDAINWEGKTANERVGVKPASVGFDFVKMMGMQLVQGRDFSRLNPTDSADGFLLNEEAVRQMHLKNPIGKWVSAWSKKGHVIGVLKDYHTQSFREAILPVMIDVKEWQDFGVIIVRTKPGETRQALASLQQVYKTINPNYAFAWQFVDEEYRKLYSGEQLITRLSVLFATLAIIISCLGLLGLVMFSAEQRTKEIGIRKVLGASMSQIITIFSMDFLRLIGIAFIIAAPLGWYFMRSWLRDFVYRIDISWWTFALAGSVSILIAALTVCYQAVRAATANPVTSLRSE